MSNIRRQEEFSDRLLKLMEKNSVSVRDAAELAGVAKSTMQDWRSGVSPANFMGLKRLAEGLNTTLGFLLTGQDETRKDGAIPQLSEVFLDGGVMFDGYAKITIQRLIPKAEGDK
jgi:transcriptional regulator with XRE-family HTH domain